MSDHQVTMQDSARIEWPTFWLLALCYLGWTLSIFWLMPLSTFLGLICTSIFIALHSSLTHEVVHDHPTRDPRLNAALVFPNLGLFIPFLRFRDTHLAHHKDCHLTDPYDDPESNYWDPAEWSQLSAAMQTLLRFNNTLLGRLMVGPVLGQLAFMASDFKFKDPAVRKGWAWHIPAIMPVLMLVWIAPISIWVYLLAAYLGLSLLKIRTFLEHRAHDHSAGRTVIIEDRGPLAWLFLNNNLHLVHHMHPSVAWYKLPQVFRQSRARYLDRNQGYHYGSYTQIFRQYFWRSKDPVPHPLWQTHEK